MICRGCTDGALNIAKRGEAAIAASVPIDSAKAIFSGSNDVVVTSSPSCGLIRISLSVNVATDVMVFTVTMKSLNKTVADFISNH